MKIKNKICVGLDIEDNKDLYRLYKTILATIVNSLSIIYLLTKKRRLYIG